MSLIASPKKVSQKYDLPSVFLEGALRVATDKEKQQQCCINTILTADDDI